MFYTEYYRKKKLIQLSVQFFPKQPANEVERTPFSPLSRFDSATFFLLIAWTTTDKFENII